MYAHQVSRDRADRGDGENGHRRGFNAGAPLVSPAEAAVEPSPGLPAGQLWLGVLGPSHSFLAWLAVSSRARRAKVHDSPR